MVTLYGDNGCGQAVGNFSADGTCKALQPNYASFKFTPAPQAATCTPASVAPSVVGEHTFCCVQ
jgi:hypothetical protein